MSEEDADSRFSGADWAALEEHLSNPTGSSFPDPVRLRLADVAGMEEVKRQIDAAFLSPLRNPELAKQYGQRLSGGLLLYGPPGCGKTFIARAIAGELGARFYQVVLTDVLDTFAGQSERNIHEIFQMCRRNSPCVLFLDEVDALGQKRSGLRGDSALRATVSQLLTEMDSTAGRNDGVFVLAATNHPWDVDTALRRPGRFDRMLLVRLPDEPARAAILRYHLRKRPVAEIEFDKLAELTDGFSGADLAQLCDSAAQRAMQDAIRLGAARPIAMPDFSAALETVKPSSGEWLQVARNVAIFANVSGAYDDLLAYLKSRRLA